MKDRFNVNDDIYFKGALSYYKNKMGVSAKVEVDNAEKESSANSKSVYSDWTESLFGANAWVRTSACTFEQLEPEDYVSHDAPKTDDSNNTSNILSSPSDGSDDNISETAGQTNKRHSSYEVTDHSDETKKILEQLTSGIGIKQKDIILSNNNFYILNPKWLLLLRNAGVIKAQNDDGGISVDQIDKQRLEVLVKHSPNSGCFCFCSSEVIEKRYVHLLNNLMGKLKMLGVRPDEIIVSSSGISILNPRVFVLLRNAGVINHHQGFYVKWRHKIHPGFNEENLHHLRIVKNAAYSVSVQHNFDSEAIEVVKNLKKLGAVATDVVISKHGISIHNPKLLSFLRNTGVIERQQNEHNPQFFFPNHFNDKRLNKVIKQRHGKAYFIYPDKHFRKKLEPFIKGLHDMGLSPLEIIVTGKSVIINNAKVVNYLVKSGVFEDNKTKTKFALNEVHFVDELNNDKLNKMKDAAQKFVTSEKILAEVIAMLEKKRDDLNAGGIFNKASPEKALALTQLIEKIKAQKESGDPEALKNVKKALVSARDDTVYNDQRTRLPLLFTKKKTDTQLILQKCLNALTLKDDSTLKAEYLSLLR